MSARGKGKYAFLFEDADVRRWYDNVARGSVVTADVYLRRLGSFCKRFSKTPKSLVSMSEGDLHNLMLDYVSLMERNGYAGGYIESTIKSVKSWLSHNGKEIRRKIKIKGTRIPKTMDPKLKFNVLDYVKVIVKSSFEIAGSLVLTQEKFPRFKRSIISEAVQGSHYVVAKDVESGLTSSATFTVNPQIKLVPAKAIRGDTINVSGTGFAASTSVVVLYAPTETVVAAGPVGTGDGERKSFSLPNKPVKTVTAVYINASSIPTTDYTVDCVAGIITFTTAPLLNDVITADYTTLLRYR